MTGSRRKRRGLWVFGLLIGIGAGALAFQIGCSSGQVAPGSAPASDPGRIPRLYARYCAACHGLHGSGNEYVSELFNPFIRDFSTGMFHVVSTQNGVPSDADLIASIRDGLPGSAMPPFGWMPDEDLAGLADHVRELAIQGLVPELQSEARMRGESMSEQEARAEAIRRMTPGPPIELGVPAVPSPETLERGERLYVENCAACHGMDGKGRTGFTWPALESILWARDLTAGIFRGGTSLAAIETRIRAGMPGSSMPPTDLEPDETAALAAYVRKLVPEGVDAKYVQRRAIITVHRVDSVPIAPEDRRWDDHAEVRVALGPMWWREDSVTEAWISGLHDGEAIALRLRWPDSSRDDRGLGGLRSDGAAIQLSDEEAPPIFGMGGPGHPVNIWHWKAFRPDDTIGLADFLERRIHVSGITDVPIYSPAPGVVRPRTTGQSLEVRGIESVGRAAADGEQILAAPAWVDGEWQLVFTRSLATDPGDGADLEPGSQLLMAVGIWNGGAGDAGGQKSISIWHQLRIDR